MEDERLELGHFVGPFAKSMIQLNREPFPKRFDSSYLQHIHKCLFENILETAGQFRDLTMLPFQKLHAFYGQKIPGKASLFQNMDFTTERDKLNQLDELIASKNNFQGLSREEFVKHAVNVFSQLHSIRPFVHGNDIVGRIFLVRLSRAAGHTLDFSLVTSKALEAALKQITEHGDTQLLHDMFENISNPDKKVLLKECIDHLDSTGVENVKKLNLVLAKEGVTYRGIFRGAGKEGCFIQGKDLDGKLSNCVVICKKEQVAPNLLRTLKNGDHVSFTTPMTFDTLIPKENVKDLTEDEICKKTLEASQIQSSVKQIQKFSKIVYGNERVLDPYLKGVENDVNAGKEVAQKIKDNPKSIAKLAGYKFLCFKSSRRRAAERCVDSLAKSVSDHAEALQCARRKVILEHEDEQRRKGCDVAMPSKKLQDLVSLPEGERVKILSQAPDLKKELFDYVDAIRYRLSQDEHKAIKESSYVELAKSVGTSVRRAEDIATVAKHFGEVKDKAIFQLAVAKARGIGQGASLQQ
ncbi:BID domain-containing T4SS effector [Bartonella ancashensis]|uniref:protein adenylyltransferase n=1 Tax=Bartonella ancashensis TaxID=1318743 RepID=A0A0M4LFK1_9HYPH|nr:BID domain-containing T4SS effector [Bartonella ancashensis]ALE03019.1 hypothetical protein PU02_0205 [Bartonella ancashensis]ARE31025.1 Bep205 [Bartonella ancashensis]